MLPDAPVAIVAAPASPDASRFDEIARLTDEARRLDRESAANQQQIETLCRRNTANAERLREIRSKVESLAWNGQIPAATR